MDRQYLYREKLSERIGDGENEENRNFRNVGRGVVIFAIGMYFAFVKAGIPYQDPTVEMQIQYMADMKVGDILSVT